MSNQIKLTIDVSDELLDKLLTVMAMTSQQNALQGAMPLLMGMGGGTPMPKEKPSKKAPIGFGRHDNVKEEEKTEED
jgi:hypothetical protein